MTVSTMVSTMITLWVFGLRRLP